jgi:hypothetical protein
MIDEKAWPKTRPRMDFDPGQESAHMRDEATKGLEVAFPEPVCNVVKIQGMKTGIAHENL